ncbi:MAG TPA: hypothetical protein DDY88_08660 [Actinobacteria bacterium]|nr:hypothetical protein [Actinomycetota bacterium]
MTTTEIAPYQNARGTTSEWSTANPTLLAGLIGWDTTLKRGKMGDGATAWNSLPYSIYEDPWTNTALLGNPTAPTQSPGDSSTKLANTAFVQAAGGLTLIVATSFVASSVVNINNCFTSTYDNYLMLISKVTGSLANVTRFRMRASAADNSAASYAQQFMQVNNTTFAGGATTGATQGTLGAADTTQGALAVNIFNPALAAYTDLRSQVNYAGGTQFYDAVAQHRVATAFDGISFYNDTGTLTGTVRIYGYKNS